MSLLEKEWFIEAPWGKICIVAWGECSSPPVLLCHGTMDNAATYRPLVKLLSKEFYYIAVELPGSGRSDHYPHGVMISVYDLVYVINLVANHFRWKTFRYMGHSLGCMIGCFYELSYPGRLSQIVNLDPVVEPFVVPADKFAQWYHKYFTGFYEKYDNYNMPIESGPQHNWKETVEKLAQVRKVTIEVAEDILQRMTEPTDNNKIRYTTDQRFKIITPPPLSQENLKRIFTGLKPPTLSIIAKTSIERGYKDAMFMFDESEYPLKNYRVRTVDGGHNVHLSNPELLAGYVAQFLLYGVEGLDSKPKL